MVEGALEVIYRKELVRLAPSYNACRFVSDLVRTATWGCYPHDAELNAPHVAEEEPVSSAKDSWARSAGEWRLIGERGTVRHSLLSMLIFSVSWVPHVLQCPSARASARTRCWPTSR